MFTAQKKDMSIQFLYFTKHNTQYCENTKIIKGMTQ